VGLVPVLGQELTLRLVSHSPGSEAETFADRGDQRNQCQGSEYVMILRHYLTSSNYAAGSAGTYLCGCPARSFASSMPQTCEGSMKRCGKCREFVVELCCIKAPPNKPKGAGWIKAARSRVSGKNPASKQSFLFLRRLDLDIQDTGHQGRQGASKALPGYRSRKAIGASDFRSVLWPKKHSSSLQLDDKLVDTI
jgi:hypothetical protein